MNYGIVAFPSKELQDFANSYRKRYDSHYAQIPPHITLRAAAEAPDNQTLQQIAEHVYELANTLKPFDIHIGKVSSFKPVTNVIYLKVDPTEQLTAIHESLYAAPFGGEAPYKFVPHITLAQGLSASEHDDIFGQLGMNNIDFSETISRIHLLYQLENGSWSVYETFRLRGE